MRKKTFLFCVLILISYVAISLLSSAPAQETEERILGYGEVIDIDIIDGLILVKDMLRLEENEYIFSYTGNICTYFVVPDTTFIGDKNWIDVMSGKFVFIFYMEGEYGERIAKVINVFSKEEKAIQIVPSE